MMKIDLNSEEKKLLAIAQDFAEKKIAPYAAQWEIARTFPLDTFTAAAEAGLCGLLAPQDYGGHDISVSAMSRIVEELASACMAFTFSLVVHNNLVGNIAKNGSELQREKYLPSLLRGGKIGAFLLTEPQGGSDAAAIQTHARAEGKNWVLDGKKGWISNGTVAGLLSVYAQTNPDLGWRGIACFLVEAEQSGVIRKSAYPLLSGHALGTGEFCFEACQVSSEAVLLGPGKAFKAAMAGIDLARILVAAMCCGILRVGLESALNTTESRYSFGQAIADYQGIQWMLADIATDLEATRLLTYHAATLHDANEETTLAAAHAKKFATRAALTRLSDCMQCMGASGLRTDHPVARHFASAKMAQYLDGTTEIQNIVINRKLRQNR